MENTKFDEHTTDKLNALQNGYDLIKYLKTKMKLPNLTKEQIEKLQQQKFNITEILTDIITLY